ncbi:MAG: zinc ABC transporter substrate-binding protein [Pseudomonadota bacterium]
MAVIRRLFAAYLFAAFVAIVTLSFAGMSGKAYAGSTANDTSKLDVVVTIGMVADVVSHVGGAHVSVTTLVGSGVDPHSYRQTRSDVERLTKADIIFMNGLHLEAQLDPLLEQLSATRTVIAVAEGVEEKHLIEADGFSGRFDPHVWMDPQLWKKTVDIVLSALSGTAPDYEAEFSKNADAFKAKIDELNVQSANLLKTVPDGERVLITAHDAFGYFGRAYDIEVIGIQGLSTESEAGLNRIEILVDTLVDRNIKAVFVESSVSDQNIRALIEGAAARGHQVIIGGTLFSDAMGKPGTYEGTYIGMIDHNSTSITRALGGDAPDRGIFGKLGAES